MFPIREVIRPEQRLRLVFVALPAERRAAVALQLVELTGARDYLIGQFLQHGQADLNRNQHAKLIAALEFLEAHQRLPSAVELHARVRLEPERVAFSYNVSEPPRVVESVAEMRVT